METATGAEPSIFEYRDYRAYLNEWFRYKKTLNPGYSGQVFAKKAGFQAHTLLGMVARGDRNLSYETQRGFAKALGLKGREAVYFEKLVLFNQARTSEDKKAYFEELITASQAAAGKSGTGKGEVLKPGQVAAQAAYQLLTRIKDHAEYLSHWYVVAIREMASLQDFSEDADWIVTKLKKRVTPKQAKQAIELLLRLGMLVRDGAGKLVSQDPAIDIDVDGIDFAVRNYHKEYLDLAKGAIDEDPLSERYLSSLTLTVKEDDLARLKERIQEFRKQLNLEFTADQGAAHTVALNVQLLQLTAQSEHKRGK